MQDWSLTEIKTYFAKIEDEKAAEEAAIKAQEAAVAKQQAAALINELSSETGFEFPDEATVTIFEWPKDHSVVAECCKVLLQLLL